MCIIKCVGNRFDRNDLASVSSKQKKIAIVFCYQFLTQKELKWLLRHLWVATLEIL